MPILAKLALTTLDLSGCTKLAWAGTVLFSPLEARCAKLAWAGTVLFSPKQQGAPSSPGRVQCSSLPSSNPPTASICTAEVVWVMVDGQCTIRMPP